MATEGDFKQEIFKQPLSTLFATVGPSIGGEFSKTTGANVSSWGVPQDGDTSYIEFRINEKLGLDGVLYSPVIILERAKFFNAIKSAYPGTVLDKKQASDIVYWGLETATSDPTVMEIRFAGVTI